MLVLQNAKKEVCGMRTALLDTHIIITLIQGFRTRDSSACMPSSPLTHLLHDFLTLFAGECLDTVDQCVVGILELVKVEPLISAAQ